jgi:hypothetical protein
MDNSEIAKTLCMGLWGLIVFVGFLLMFLWAVWKGEFIFSSGKIRGTFARIIGVIGLMGLTAAAYWVIGSWALESNLPFTRLAGFVAALLVVFLLVIRFLSLFFWHSKESGRFKK